MNIEFDYEFKCNQQCDEIIVFFNIVFSGLAMILSIVISFFFVFRHLNNYSNLFFQVLNNYSNLFFQDKIVGSFFLKTSYIRNI